MHRLRRWGESRLCGLQAGLVAVALALGAMGQWQLDRRAALALPVAAMILASALFAVGARWPARSQPCSPGALVVRGGLLRWGMGFGLLAFVILGENQFNLYGLTAWFLALGLCFLALPRTRPAAPRRSLWTAIGCGSWRVSWPAVGLAMALAAGAWLRFHRLLEIPADLGWDLPYNYFDAQRILRGEQLIFFPDNYGREGLFFYLIAGVSRVMGLSPYSIRVTSALVGMAAIPAVYGLVCECADEPTASLAALGLAVNKWHVVLSRSGYRVILMPLMATLALYALARALRRGQARDWAWLGLFLGLGLWSYKAFTFAVATVIGCVVLCMLAHLPLSKRSAEDDNLAGRGALRSWLAALALTMLVMAATAAPLLRFVVDEPKVYLSREALGGELVDESLARAGMTRLQLYGSNLLTSLGMYNYQGDGNPRFGVPFQRQFGYMSGVFLVLGVGAALRRFRSSSTLLLIAVAGLTLPMTVSMLAGEMPNLFRSSGVLGPAVALAACGVRAAYVTLSRWAEELGTCSIRLELRSEGSRDADMGLRLRLVWLPIVLVTIVGAAEAWETSRFYFADFRRVAPDVQNYSIALELAKCIVAFEDGPAYIKVWPHWYDGRAVREHVTAASHDWDGEVFEISPEHPPFAGFQGKMLVLLHPEDQESLEALQGLFTHYMVLTDRYPDGQISLLAFYGER
jgi:hypothetical protein